MKFAIFVKIGIVVLKKMLTDDAIARRTTTDANP